MILTNTRLHVQRAINKQQALKPLHVNQRTGVGIFAAQKYVRIDLLK